MTVYTARSLSHGLSLVEQLHDGDTVLVHSMEQRLAVEGKAVALGLKLEIRIVQPGGKQHE